MRLLTGFEKCGKDGEFWNAERLEGWLCTIDCKAIKHCSHKCCNVGFMYNTLVTEIASTLSNLRGDQSWLRSLRFKFCFVEHY